MRRSGGGGETNDEEGIRKDESVGSIAEGDSPGATVNWFRLKKLSSARISSGNKETLGSRSFVHSEGRYGGRHFIFLEGDMMENSKMFGN